MGPKFLGSPWEANGPLFLSKSKGKGQNSDFSEVLGYWSSHDNTFSPLTGKIKMKTVGGLGTDTMIHDAYLLVGRVPGSLGIL